VAKPVIDAAWKLLPGLSGNSWCDPRHQQYVHRLMPAQPFPFVDRQREYRVLRQLQRAGLGIRPINYHCGDLTVEWVQGDPLAVTDFSPHNPDLMDLLARLHHHALLGYRLQLIDLLQRYWQLCQQRHAAWLTRLQSLIRQGEPKPLRLVPLHMDVHAGNLIQTAQGLVLIDWEYSADGDIALELATLCLQDPPQAEQWIAAYAQRFNLKPQLLRAQVQRWQPWLRLLQASWYQLKAEQTQQPAMEKLAAQSWQSLSHC